MNPDKISGGTSSIRDTYKKMFGRPNFILIHTDQQRADCVHAYGRRPELYTPYQDSIASMGVRFDASYAACPVCIPQRLSLLTGQSPQKHGVYDNLGIPGLDLGATLPKEMAKAGYRTALIGRTMHTYPFTDPCGFDDYFPGDPSSDCKDQDGLFNFISEQIPAGSGGYYGNGTLNNSRFAAPFHLENRFHQTMWATNQALDYIRARRKEPQPFMLCLGFYAPHSPHNPPKEWFEHYIKMNLTERPAIADYDIPPITNGHAISPYVNLAGQELQMLRAGYYGNISFLDSQVGRILNEVMTMPNTYVIFTSDHGEMLGDHYHVHKSLPYQGAVHTPFLVYGPGIAGNRVVNTPITWQDIMPTVLELADVAIPKSVDGISFAKTLLGTATEKEREYVHGEGIVSEIHFGGYEGQVKENNLAFENGYHYLTDGKTKYIWYTRSGREQLFDLEDDYQELHDLAQDVAHREMLLKWRSILIQELAGRPEGFSDGEQLHCGREEHLSPMMEKLCLQKLKKGEKIAYYRPRALGQAKASKS